MKAKIDSKHLHIAVSDAIKAVDTKVAVPVFTCMLVTAVDGMVSVTGMGRGAMTSRWPAIGEPENVASVAVDASKLLKAATVMKNDGELTLAFSDDGLVLSNKDGENVTLTASQDMMDSFIDYLAAYDLRSERMAVPVDLPTVLRVLTDAVKFASREETRAHLRGVWFHENRQKDGDWRAMATDGHTLLRVKDVFLDRPVVHGFVTDKFMVTYEPVEALLKTHAAKAFAKHVAHCDTEIDVFPHATVGEGDKSKRMIGNVCMVLPYREVEGALLEVHLDTLDPDTGKMVDYEHLITAHELAVERAENRDDDSSEVLEVVGRITVPVDDLRKRVDRAIKFGGKGVTVALGAVGGEVRLATTGKDAKYDAAITEGKAEHFDRTRHLFSGFRAEYLARVLDVMKGNLTIHLSGKGPNGIRSTGRPEYFILLMPITIAFPEAWDTAG